MNILMQKENQDGTKYVITELGRPWGRFDVWPFRIFLMKDGKEVCTGRSEIIQDASDAADRLNVLVRNYNNSLRLRNKRKGK